MNKTPQYYDRPAVAQEAERPYFRDPYIKGGLLMSAQDNVIQLKKRRKKQKPKRVMRGGDFWLVALVFGLVVFGIVMVFSASYYYSISKEGSPYYYLIRDMIFAVFGTVLFMVGAMVDYHKWKKWSIPALLLSIILLCILLVPSLPFVVELNGQARWIGVGPVTIMPGEIAKAAVILCVATWLSRKPNMILKVGEGILPMLALMGVVGGLIGINNAITAATVAAIIMGMMFVAGMRLKYLFGLIGIGGAAIAGLVILEPYRMKRVVSFLDPFADPRGAGYQVVQGLLALGSGGLFGKGLGRSVQKTLYLPEPQNDFILAIIGEEIGYIGLLFLLLAYMLLIWRCVHISMNAPDLFGTLLGSGITIMLAVQVVLNVMVVTSLAPPTGIILPFVSWGGNALMIFMGAMGIMLNISRQMPR